MNTRFLLLAGLWAFSISSNTAFAQAPKPADEGMRTLLGGRTDIHHGGWGAPTSHYTRLLDQDALLVGARGGWLIDHRVTIGLAGHGLTTVVRNRQYDAMLVDQGVELRRPSTLSLGYGGLLIEPIIAYRSPVHISLPIIIGAGGCAYAQQRVVTQEDDVLGYRWDDGQAFFVVEPGIDLELNIIPLVRLGVGASYRYTSDVDLPATAKDALHGLNVGFAIKVGSF
jgi:hypothetical protein